MSILIIPMTMSGLAAADVIWADGEYHLLDYRLDDNLKVSGYCTVYDPPRSTTADIVSGGIVGGNLGVGSWGIVNMLNGMVEGNMLASGDLSQINVAGGTVGGNVEISQISSVIISSATIEGSVHQTLSFSYLSITDTTIGGDLVTGLSFSDIEISNVQIQGQLHAILSAYLSLSDNIFSGGVWASDFSRVILSNCYISGQINAQNHGWVRLDGTDFRIDGTAVDYGLIGENSGHLTGLTYDGKLIDADFLITDNAGIILAPEPGTILLLGLGGLLLRKRR